MAKSKKRRGRRGTIKKKCVKWTFFVAGAPREKGAGEGYQLIQPLPAITFPTT